MNAIHTYLPSDNNLETTYYITRDRQGATREFMRGRDTHFGIIDGVKFLCAVGKVPCKLIGCSKTMISGAERGVEIG